MSDLETAVRKGDFKRGLELALKRWDKSRARALGDLIERLGAHAPKDTPALVTADPKKLSIGDMEALMAASSKLPPDPRIAGAMTRMLLHPPFTSLGSRGVWTPLLEQLEETHADPRTLDALEPVAADYVRIFGATKMGERMQRGVQGVVKALKARFDVVAADAEAQALLGGLPAAPEPAAAAGAPAPKAKKASAGGGTGADELLALVYASPDDDAPRLVYADWLLERGDPRGELITLQFRRHRGEMLSEDEQRREHQLLEKHTKAWLGPLAAVTRREKNVFSRGFLETCFFQPRGAATALAINHPSWATVRQLHIHSNGTKDFGEELMSHRVMRHVRVLRDCNGSLLETLLVQKDFALETLAYTWANSRLDPAAGARAWPRLLAGDGLPNLRHLMLVHETSLAPADIPAFLASPLAKRLDRLTMIHWDTRLEALRQTPAPTERLEVDLFLGGERGRVRVRRGADGNMSATETIADGVW